MPARLLEDLEPAAELRAQVAAAALDLRRDAEVPADVGAPASGVVFDQPRALQRAEPALYGVLSAFYRQDPAGLEH